MLRPSLKSTRMVSSETVTSWAKGTAISMAEVRIPSLHKPDLMFTNQRLDASDFYPRKSTTALQPNRIEPEFRDPIIPFDVHKWRFVAVPGVEEQAIGAGSQYCGHGTARLFGILRLVLLGCIHQRRSTELG